MEVRYIGDPSNKFEGPAEIDQYGFTFVKGDYVSVPDNHEYARKFKNNPTFQVKGDDRPTAAINEEAEADELRKALDDRRIQYRANASNAKLQKLLADAVEAEDVNDAPPVPAK